MGIHFSHGFYAPEEDAEGRAWKQRGLAELEERSLNDGGKLTIALYDCLNRTNRTTHVKIATTMIVDIETTRF